MKEKLSITEKLEEQRAIYNKLYKEQDAIYRHAGLKANLSEASFWVMYCLCDGNQNLTQSTFCKEWFFSKQTINSAVKGLAAKGFIDLKPEDGKGNRKTIILTKDGEKYCKENIMPLIRADQKAFASFSDEERELLLSLMQRQLELLKKETEHLWQ